jgi:hemerythrin-like domain-containing protein
MSDDASATRRVNRRTLLATTSGVLVGAAATETANLLSGGQSTSAPHVASPGEELMTEHGVLKRVLLAYNAISAQLAAGKTPPDGVVTDAAQIISDYIESFHEGLEEAYVFPRLQRAGQHVELIRTLLVQHDRGRHVTAAILAAADDLRFERTRAAVRTYIEQFVRMYAAHEAWEDTVVFPALRAVTAERTLQLLAERFADEENAQYGDHALARILGRVEGIEQQLGIDDLAALTPPAPPAT